MKKNEQEELVEKANFENSKNVMKFLELFPKTSMKKDGTRIVSYRGFWFKLFCYEYYTVRIFH